MELQKINPGERYAFAASSYYRFAGEIESSKAHIILAQFCKDHGVLVCHLLV